MTRGDKWHFIGIGGVGMSGLAKAYLEMGKKVSGSDLVASELTDHLSALGAKIHIGSHNPANITHDLNSVVISSAIRPDNPELRAAEEKGIPVIHRGVCLANLMAQKKGIAIAGSHGKTTTSAMIAWLLDKSGLQPSYFIGALAENLKTNAKWGGGEFLVAETDESDGSFLKLSPFIAVVTNVENDHMDHYGSTEKIDEAFVSFINSVHPAGKAILCLDDPGIVRLLPKINHKRLTTYGGSAGADLRGANFRFENGKTRAEVYWKEKPAGTIELQLYGKHNLLNALGALAAGMECGSALVSLENILRDFQGTKRRMEYLGEAANIRFFDDYAHHPTEIRATLEAVKSIGAKRTIAVFQPHRYTRTKLLAEEFGGAFWEADELILLPVYSAGETPIDGVGVGLIADRIMKQQNTKPAMAADFKQATELVFGMATPGDLVLTLGAGDVRTVGEMILHRLRNNEG